MHKINRLSKMAVALTAVAACSFAFADMTDSDQARRQRNVDEVLAKHHVNLDSTSYGTQSVPSSSHSTMKQKTHHIAEKTRETTHEAADSTRNFTHRQLDKARDFGARTNEKYPAKEGHEPGKLEMPQS